jgi:hypothetical protein
MHGSGYGSVNHAQAGRTGCGGAAVHFWRQQLCPDAPKSRSNMMRRLIWSWVTLAIVFAGMPGVLYKIIRVRCTVTSLTEAISYDGTWKAMVEQRFCESPFLTHSAAEVHLVSAHDPARSAHILGVSANGADEDPDIAWTGPRTL